MVSLWRDFFTVAIIKSYHKNKGDTADIFSFLLSSHKLVTIFETKFNMIFEKHQMHVSTLCEFYNKRNAKLTDLEIVGDMHGSASTRVMIESNNERVIATTSEWRTSSAFCEFLTTLDADFKHLLPTWTFKNQIYQRPYITPEQNTSSKETIREYFFYL